MRDEDGGAAGRQRAEALKHGVLGLGGDLTTWSAEELKEAAGLVAAYKRVRPVVQHGTAHRLRGAGTLTGVHYVLGDDQVILACEPPPATPRWPA